MPFDQIAIYQNSFIQGDTKHPGLIKTTNYLLKKYNMNLPLNEMIGHSHNTVYSNYTQTQNICPELSNYLNQDKACGKIEELCQEKKIKNIQTPTQLFRMGLLLYSLWSLPLYAY